MVTWHELEAVWGELRRVGHTILPTSGQIKYAWRQGRERGTEREGEGKTGKQIERIAGKCEAEKQRGEWGWTGGQALVRWCERDWEETIRQRFETALTAHSSFPRGAGSAPKKGEKEIITGNASLGTSPFLWKRVCIQHWPPSRRLNEGGRCTCCQSHTYRDPNTHLGLQHTHKGTNAAPSFYRHRGEEEGGEYLNAWSFWLLFSS